MNEYPHMCRDGHPEIGHRMSDDDERCPLCRERDAYARLVEAAKHVDWWRKTFCVADSADYGSKLLGCISLSAASIGDLCKRIDALRAALAEVEELRGERA